MKKPRPSRFIAAVIALISVLFTQLAVAAYACPGMEVGQAMMTASMAAAEVDHHMRPDCEEIDMEQPVFCHAHTQVGKQSLDKPDRPNVSPSVAVLLVPVVSDIHVAYRPIAPSADAAAFRPATAPPLSIQYCCFRI